MHDYAERDIQGDCKEPDKKSKTDEIRFLLKTECEEEARLILQELENHTEDDHVNCVYYAHLKYVFSLPVAEFMSHDCEDLIAMVLMLPDKRLSDHDLVKLKACVGMQVVVILHLEPDLPGIEAFSRAHLIHLVS